uniref:Uncharacterized protein n=1 Tax=Anguilla anguilla TaxID=7936 RepID=A0A0E9XYY5_ANGAN
MKDTVTGLDLQNYTSVTLTSNQHRRCNNLFNRLFLHPSEISMPPEDQSKDSLTPLSNF